MSKTITVTVDAARYENEDNCLAVAAADAAKARGLQNWDLNPRWADNQRNEILLDVPAWAAIACHDSLSGERFAVPDGDDAAVESAIRSYILDGLDHDSGVVEYRVETSDGRSFSGVVNYGD